MQAAKGRQGNHDAKIGVNQRIELAVIDRVEPEAEVRTSSLLAVRERARAAPRTVSGGGHRESLVNGASLDRALRENMLFGKKLAVP